MYGLIKWVLSYVKIRFLLQVISQISENGGLSEETRTEIETFLTDLCANISDVAQLADYPNLAEFESETECIDAVRSALDKIPEPTNNTSSDDSLRCLVLNNLRIYY